MTHTRSLGSPRLHLRVTDSTNVRAMALAQAGAPHGALVTAGEQTAGRGRQGRQWTAPAGRALLASVVIRDPPEVPSLRTAVAVANAIDGARPGEPPAQIKWPNDVLLPAAGKVAGILVEGRPQDGWAVIGVGCNVALRPEDFPEELRGRAASLGLPPDAIEPLLDRLLAELERQLSVAAEDALEAWRRRDALLGQEIAWAGGRGRGAGIDGAGRLVVELPGHGPGRAARTTLEAGEVHLIGVG